MLKYIFTALVILNLAGCSSAIVGDPGKPISLITVKHEGKYNEGRTDMATVCKGFYLSEKEVSDFYTNAARIEESDDTKKYDILPCYAHGTAAINGMLYNWVIRAGGVGQFYTENDRFIKICGKKCCKKVPGIC